MSDWIMSLARARPGSRVRPLPGLARGVLLAGIGLALATTGALAQSGTAIRSYAAAATPEGDLPGYVSKPTERLRYGAEVRTRFEDRSGRLRGAAVPTELTFGLVRSRTALALESEQTAFRFLFEAQDARQFATDVPETSLTVNELDVLQLRLGVDLDRVWRVPVAVEVGRLSFDAIDRRLVARNRFRNTTNAFDGVRVRVGRNGSPLGLELMAVLPVTRSTERLDRSEMDRKLVGAVASLRRSRMVLEPYYLLFDTRAGTLHTAGVHLFGTLGERWDHDFHASFQVGRLGADEHDALAFHGELGRRFGGEWAPRLSLWLNYASGDAEPGDGRSGRFNPLFGAAHKMYAFTDLVSWQNIVNPTLAIALGSGKLRLELLSRVFWLASAKDAFVRAGLHDPAGRSGTFVGHELDVELRYALFPFAELNAQYGRLFAGGFVERAGGGTGATVVYVALTLSTS